MNVLLKVAGSFAVRLSFRVNVPLKVDGSLKVAEPIFTLVSVICDGKVAIPTTLAHSFLQSSARSVVDVLEEQATGIVAEKAK